MIKKIAALILFIIMLIVTFYIKSQVDAFNMEYYHGKDNGAFVQLESLIIFSFIFFMLISKSDKIIYSFLSLIVSIICSIICYIIFGTEVLFPISASLLIMAVFYLIEYYWHKNDKQVPK